MNWIFASLPLLVFSMLTWIALGLIIVRRVFKLRDGLTVCVFALSCGMIAYLFLVNALSYFISVPITVWLVNIGIWIAVFWLSRHPLPPLEWEIERQTRIYLAVAGSLLFIGVLIINAREIFIDTSGHAGIIQLFATGNFPPRFQCNPDDVAGYHYGANMLAAALVDTTGVTPWDSQDVLAAYEVICLCALVILILWRRTKKIRVCLLGIFLFFTVGQVVWLLLPLTSPGWSYLAQGSPKISELTTMLYPLDDSPWTYAIFTPGFLTPTIGHAHRSIAWSLGPLSILLFLALLETTFDRRWLKALTLGYLLGTVPLLQSASLIPLSIGFGGLTLLSIVRPRQFSLDFNPVAVIAVSLLVAALQGGVITDGITSKLSGSDNATTAFALTSPTLPSCPKDGNTFSCIALSFTNLGLIPFLMPSFAVMTFRGRKDDAQVVLVIGTVASYILVTMLSYGYVQWNLIRIISFCTWPLAVYMTPWLYRHLTSDSWRRWATLAFIVVSTYSGVITLWVIIDGRWARDALTLDFIPMVPATDRSMMEQARRLPLNAIIFDSSTCEHQTGSRPAYVFGRYTRTATNRSLWMQPPEGFDKLLKMPTAEAMAQAGYTHVYVDQKWYYSMDEEGQNALKQGNYEVMASVGTETDFRTLLRICSESEQCVADPAAFPRRSAVLPDDADSSPP